MRQLLVYILVIMLSTLPSLSYAGDIQTPISIENPSNIFKNTDVNNGLDPVQPYKEYGTTGSPMRTPIQFQTLPCKGTADQCHFPTNKWFTDIIFKSNTIPGNDKTDPTGEDFRVGQSPYTLRLFDDVVTLKNGHVTLIPGIYISINDPYVVVSKDGPSAHGFYSDTYVKTLQLSAQNHFAFTTKIDGANQISNDVTRTILDYGPLHLNTEWLHNPSKGKLSTWLTRGSPYITVQYENMPITLFQAENTGFVAMGSDDPTTGSPFIFSRDPDRATKQGISGQIFRFIVLVNDETAGSTDPNSGGDPNKIPPYSYPIRYVEYMLFTDSPITLYFQPTTPESNYQLLYTKTTTETPPNIIVRAAYVGSGLALYNGSPTRDVAQAEDYVLANVLNNNLYANTESMLTQYANVYPTGATINLATSGSTEGSATFNWKTSQFSKPLLPIINNTQLLMLAFQATQKDLLTTEDSAQFKVDHNYAPLTIRGKMFPISGKTWTLKVPFSPEFSDDNLWVGSKSVPAQYTNELLALLQSDAGMLINPQIPGTDGNTLIPFVLNDSYGFGKQIARLARLVILAEQLGDNTSLQKFLIPLKQYLSLWFDGGIATDPVGGIQNYFNYDKKFGGVITARASYLPGADGCIVKDVHDNVCGYDQDFYSGQYTDHHFHFGYFIYAAAVLAKIDSQWLDKYKEKVNLLVRDITNPSDQDFYFTPYRYFDWFEGHAYANGLVPGGSGRNQESTSEGLNAWYAVTLWGLVTNNANLKNIGKILSSREILAAQKWTQISPGDSIYDNFFAKAGTQNNKHDVDIYMNEGLVTGINWANKIDHGTFFGTRLTYMAGIQMMPYTPASTALLSPIWLANVQAPLNAAVRDRLNLIKTYSNIDNTGFGSVIKYFADEWPGYLAAKQSSAPIDKLQTNFWADLQSIPKDAYQWSLINALSLAPVAADIAYTLFTQNSNGEFYNAMIKGENSFESAGLQKNPIVKYHENCSPIDTAYPDACFLDTTNIYRNTVVPYFAVDYNIIDQGMSLTNAMWWIFIHKTTPALPSLYWTSEIKIDLLTGDAVTISWQPPVAIPADPKISYHYTVKIRGQGQTEDTAQCNNIDTFTCSINKLSGTTPYLINITAQDRSTSSSYHGIATRTLRIYTKPAGIVSTINWPGEIQYPATNVNTVELSWSAATLVPPPPLDPNVKVSFAAAMYTANDNKVVFTCPVDKSLSCTVTGLAPNTNYYAKIIATAEGKAEEVDKQTPVFQTNTPDQPVLTWDTPGVTPQPSTNSVKITWNQATVTPTSTPINYNAVVTNVNPDASGGNCMAQNDTNCEVGDLSPGKYKVIVTASVDPDLSIPSQSASFDIGSIVNNPDFSVCKRPSIPRYLFITFSSAPTDIQSWRLNNSTPVTGQMSNPTQYVIDTEGLALKPINVSVTYQDGTVLTEPVTPCQ